MKKIYSIVLMATALLLGTNVQAATNVSTADELIAAFADPEVTEIQLDEDITMTKSAVLVDGRTLKLDLGSKTISCALSAFAYHAPIILAHGTLHVINGTIENNAVSSNNSAAILVFGAGYNKETGEAMDDQKEWSNLFIGDGEHQTFLYANGVTAAGAQKAAGVEVYTFGTKWSVNAKQNGWSFGGGIYPTVTNTYKKADPKVPVFGTYAAKNAQLAFMDDLAYEPSHQGKPNAAFGVNITVKANAYVYGSKYGLQISGQVQATGNNVPVLNVEKGAVVYAHATANESTGIYAAGAGETNINGEVHGSTGVYIKSGEVNVGEGAVVYSDNNTFNDVDHKRSGVDAGGSAIIYETNKAYAGEISINVTDGALVGAKLDENGKIVETGAGYAIQGAQEPNVDNELKGIDIQGGTIVAGGMGALETQVLEEALTTGGATLVIDGAEFKTDDQGITDLNNLLAIAGSTTLIVQTEDGQYTIEQAPAGTVVAKPQDINTTTEKYIELEGGEQELTKDVEFTYIALKAAIVRVPAGITLKAGSIVLDKDAVIDVQLGGKLVITDKDGLVANQTSNIKIAAKEGEMGIFMLSPKAEANRNPAATVTLETKAHKDGENYLYQRMGVPAVNGIKVSEMKANPASAGIALAYWDGPTQNWAWVPNTSYLLQPFVGLALTNNAAAEGTKYVMPCRLMGNSNANLSLVGAWTSFANSYMANVDLYSLLNDILAAGEGVSASVYVYDAPSDYWKTITWYNLDKYWHQTGVAPEYLALEPMQGFIFNNLDENINAQAVIDYEKDVWDPIFDPNHETPKGIAARRANGNNTTSVQITITGENGQSDAITLNQDEQFSAAFDNGCDAKAMTGINPINIFATTEIGNLAAVATDNLVGVKLSVNTKAETMFKMTFSNLEGEQLAIRDNLTGSVIEMKEGAEYFFAVAENTVSERFEIVNPKYAPTDVESVIANENVKAVYTVLGQYVGTTDNWNILPAGIYVIDGVKMVK